MRGSDVLNVQHSLVRLGYLGGELTTGFFGRLTEAAVRRFQAERGIVSSGTSWTTGFGSVGPLTRSALVRELSRGSSNSASSTNALSLVTTQGNSLSAYNSQSGYSGPPVNSQIISAYAQGSYYSQASYTIQTSDYTQASYVGSSCAFNAQLIASGNVVTAYEASSVANLSRCVSERRTCNNGFLSGSFAYASCSVSAPFPNGVECTAHDQCASNYCYPGPQSKFYCLDAAKNCAKPGTDGIYFGEDYYFQGKNHLCVVGFGLKESVGTVAYAQSSYYAQGTYNNQLGNTTSAIFANVKDFGAKGDWVTDDTAAVQAALNSGKPTVYIPVGTFKVGGLTVPSSVKRIYSDGGELGQGRLLQRAPHSNILNVSDASDLTIEGLGFIGNTSYGSSASVNSGIALTNSTRVTIRNSMFTGFLLNAVHTKYSSYVTIANNHLYENYSGLSCVGSNHMTITGNHLEKPLYPNQFTVGIALAATDLSLNDICEYITISDNNVEGWDNAQAIMGHAGRHITVTGNRVVNALYPIQFNPCSCAPHDEVDDVVISNNIVVGSNRNTGVDPDSRWGTFGIAVTGNPGIVKNIRILNNTLSNINVPFAGVDRGAIVVAYASNVEVANNSITDSYENGVSVADSTSVNIHNNAITRILSAGKQSIGINVYKLSTGRIENNSITVVNDKIVIAPGSDFLVSGN